MHEGIFVVIQRNNLEMGVYHQEKMRGRMNTAGMNGSARTQNLEGMFLDGGAYQRMHDALTSKDQKKMMSEYLAMREVCMACHVAENVGFLNDSAVFARTARFPMAAR
jgi:membrane protease subunit (stomatin/prohibitin family)